MFNLDKAINKWVKGVYGDQPLALGKMAELKDHLYSAVEALTAQGHSSEMAFKMATEKMGNRDDLANENLKNGNRFMQLMQSLDRWGIGLSAKQSAALNIGFSLVFAVLIVMADSIWPELNEGNTLTYILLAIWFVPFSILSGFEAKKRRKKVAE